MRLWSKEIHEKMKNKVVDIYQSGKGYKVLAKHREIYYPQMEKTWNGSEPSPEWPANKN